MISGVLCICPGIIIILSIYVRRCSVAVFRAAGLVVIVVVRYDYEDSEI